MCNTVVTKPAKIGMKKLDNKSFEFDTSPTRIPKDLVTKTGLSAVMCVCTWYCVVTLGFVRFCAVVYHSKSTLQYTFLVISYWAAPVDTDCPDTISSG